MNTNSQRIADFITHASISLGSAKYLQLVKEKGLLDLVYRYTEKKGDGNGIEWRKISALSINEEVVTFLAKEFKENGRINNITVTELLSELRKTISDTRLLIKVFDMTPIELLSYVDKDDTKTRLLKSLT